MSSDGVKEAQNWKVKKRDGSRLEPANLSVLRQWVASHQIEPDDLVINDDLADWIRAAEVLELFDLFEQSEAGSKSVSPVNQKEKAAGAEFEIITPDCAYHPGRTASEICVGCGKFVCGECGERLENKFYCRRCLAEKQVGVEPGAPAGPGAIARIIPGVREANQLNRVALASLAAAVVAIAASFLMIIPGYVVAVAPAVGFISFLAALLGAVALGNIRLRKSSARSRQFALAGLFAGLAVLILSVGAISFSIREVRSAYGRTGNLRSQGDSILPQISRRQTPIGQTTQTKEEREANARQLMEQVAEYLKAGQLEQAISTGRTLVGLYPETGAAKLVEERLPVIEQALAAKQAQEKEVQLQNEDIARRRLDHALQLSSGGNQTAALDLLRSIVDGYPGTESADLAKKEVEKIENVLANQRLKQQDQEASLLAHNAEKYMTAADYDKAAELYGRIVTQYSDTPTAASVRSAYEEAQLLATDPSERGFRKIQQNLADRNYEQTIDELQDFLGQYPNSKRFEDAKAMLQENITNKSIADGLYNFGRAYMAEQKYSLALGRYEKLIKEHPRSQWIPQAKKDYEEALEKLQE